MHKGFLRSGAQRRIRLRRTGTPTTWRARRITTGILPFVLRADYVVRAAPAAQSACGLDPPYILTGNMEFPARVPVHSQLDCTARRGIATVGRSEPAVSAL